jgi:aspartate oxidase
MTSKVEDLFRAPAEELVKLPYSAWEETCSGVHGEDLQLIANKLIDLAVKAARMGTYCDARAKGRQHEAAVREQNAVAEQVRAALDFQHPKDDVEF